MHGVWEWDSAKNAGAVLRETYFVNDPATGRKVRHFFYLALVWLVGMVALMVAQIDWYTDFYYPILKRWTERVRRVIANRRGHEKLFFTEPIPNEVKRWCFGLAISQFTHNRASSVRRLGHRNTNPRTWYSRPTG
jgi:hypothetical protein